MRTTESRLLALEARHAPARAGLLIVLNEGEEPTPEQQSEIDWAEKNNQPTLTIILGAARHGK